MDWNDSYIASAFLPIAIRLSSRAHCYCNSGPRRRIVQPEISICSGEEYPISATGRSERDGEMICTREAMRIHGWLRWERRRGYGVESGLVPSPTMLT